MYQLKTVSKTYTRRGRDVVALAETDLAVDAGEFVALVGPSGSGKTTLLTMLGGMLAPTTGRILIEGRSLYDLSLEKRAALRRDRIGFVFQSFNLVPWLSARENVQVPLCLADRSTAEQSERAVELLERFGLGDRLDHRPAELSQGQQQRVALARTLANDPRIILADEPTGNLDPASRELVLDTLAGFHDEGRTIVMVTHDAHAASFAKRVMQLEEGRVRDGEEVAHAA